MTTRRAFLVQSTAAMGAIAGCSADSGYVQAVAETWRHSSEADTAGGRRLRELVRYATLAPSSHNTQCWKFRIAADARGIAILPDFSRRCPAVDPDDHHLFVSLGCAAENLVQAALADGLAAQTQIDSDTGTVGIALAPTQAVRTPLFEAIPQRQSTRAEYDGNPLAGAELEMLERAGTSERVKVLLLTERTALERVLEFVIQGNTAQMRDTAFVDELRAWIRFNGADAMRAGDGLFAGASGNPSLPSWLAKPVFGWVFTPKSENDKYAKHVRSSAGIAIFIADDANRASWVEVGRCYERFALQAAALGVRNAFLNQPIEVAAIRPAFATFLGVGARRPDLVVRFGRGPLLPRSLRRPVDAVIA